MSQHESCAELTEAELQDLDACEWIIEQGLESFKAVGQALLRVKARKLYRKKFRTWELYCTRRWGFTGERGRQLIEAAEIAGALEDAGLPLPDNDAQARMLSGIDPMARARVWELACQTAPGGKVTAAWVEQTYRRLLEADRAREPGDDDGGDDDEEAPTPPPAELSRREQAAANATRHQVVTRDQHATTLGRIEKLERKILKGVIELGGLTVDRKQLEDPRRRATAEAYGMIARGRERVEALGLPALAARVEVLKELEGELRREVAG